MIRALTTFYQESSPVRLNEYLTAFDKNLQNKFISEVVILLEGDIEFPIKHDKIVIVKITKRPTFNDFINTANALLKSENDISIIFNSDIYFDHSAKYFYKLKPFQVYALNRWDVQENGKVSLFSTYKSNDAWAFRGKIKPIDTDYFLGQLGCDNRFLFDLSKHGYSIKNPCFTIRIFHLHLSNLRGDFSTPSNTVNRVHPPYGYSVPNFLSVVSFFILIINFGFVKSFIFFLIKRNVKFQFYYDFKNQLIEHENIPVNFKTFSKLRYWLTHDYKFDVLKRNKFNLSDIEKW